MFTVWHTWYNKDLNIIRIVERQGFAGCIKCCYLCSESRSLYGSDVSLVCAIYFVVLVDQLCVDGFRRPPPSCFLQHVLLIWIPLTDCKTWLVPMVRLGWRLKVFSDEGAALNARIVHTKYIPSTFVDQTRIRSDGHDLEAPETHSRKAEDEWRFLYTGAKRRRPRGRDEWGVEVGVFDKEYPS